jgi:hypothetical protein
MYVPLSGGGGGAVGIFRRTRNGFVVMLGVETEKVLPSFNTLAIPLKRNRLKYAK